MKFNYRSITARFGDSATLDLGDFTHRIILFGAIALIVFFIAGLFVLTPGRALSFSVGGILSILNFKWLKDMVDAALYADVRKKKKRITVKFFLRYGLILLTLYGILHVSRTYVLFAFLGLFVIVVAVFIECFYQLVKASKAKREGKKNA